MYSDHVTFEIVGQIMIATLFLGTAIINSTTKVKQHAERMLALKVPAPYLTLWIGFIIQYTGGILILIDFWTELGVSLLIVFTITATLIFHRFWLVEDPLMRHIHMSNIYSNIGILGGLILLL
ncbi:MAG: DoxX family protein [Alphaproteobacteria bacterium]|nr:DoxX family protein [Alphaproteobacteria bacterium]|tara:strand:- start:799 stop:1167 length:369 start_codon:yes stop_codon:yes gene_type:complete